MNTKKWLTLGLTVALAGCLGWAVAACAPTEPNPNDPDNPSTPHTHTFTGWDHSETEHWRVCPDDGEIDVTTRAPHVFVGGECECGMKEADITPDEGRDTRSFWVVGSGAGDLSKCSFTELKSDFKLTKQPKKDANGYTVYTTSVLTLYAGDTMKIVQDLDWDDGLGYFGVSNIKNNDGSLVDGGGPGNITPAKGKDGKYIFTVRTKADIAFSQCTLEFTFVEPVEPLKNTEEIYIVGSLEYCNTQWPKQGSDGKISVAGCKKLDYDEATGEWSIVLRLGRGPGVVNGDEFKLYNAVNGRYYPDGTGNNVTVGGSVDGEISQSSKASGDYKISWKSGDTDVTLTKLEHTHVFDRMVYDDNQHWTECWLDNTVKPDSVCENHLWENDEDEKCDTCGRTRHVHKYTQQMYDETEHWMECPTDHAIDPEHPKTAHTIDPETHKCDCGYVQHVHQFTKQNKDTKQHWMECPDDGEISPEGKQDHVFDQEGGKCVCGAVDTTGCDHSKGYAFEYDALPAVSAEGGTLDKFCPDCRDKQTVTYLKGFTGDGNQNVVGTIGDISEEGSYYFDFKSGTSWQALGIKITEAGTYTLTFENVCDLKGRNGENQHLALAALVFGTAYATSFSASDVVNQNKLTNLQTATEYGVKFNGETLSEEVSPTGNCVSISFTVTDEQLQGGAVFVTVCVVGQKDGSSVLGSVRLGTLSCLATVKKD